MIIPCCSVWQKALNKLKIQMLYDKKAYPKMKMIWLFYRFMEMKRIALAAEAVHFVKKEL